MAENHAKHLGKDVIDVGEILSQILLIIAKKGALTITESIGCWKAFI